MRSPGAIGVASLVLVAVLLLVAPHSVRTATEPVVWFTPNAGSPDMLALFTQPDQWADARAHMTVFKFYQGHVLDDPPPPSYFFPNDYENLRSVGAFEKLTREWHKQIAIEAASVKPFFCTSDSSGMRSSILQTLRSIANVREAGGKVSQIAMDEPFTSGVSPECGGPDPAPTVTRLQQYMRIVHAVEPGVAIGLIEAYPFFSASQIADFIIRMRHAGIPPAFFQVDVDFHALSLKPYDFAADMRRLKEASDLEGMPFGYIFWGENVDSDVAYAQRVMDRVRLIKSIFGSFDRLPDQLVFQSFSVTASGLKIVPLNLPESNPDSHTGLMDHALFVLHGFAAAGTATPRR